MINLLRARRFYACLMLCILRRHVGNHSQRAFPSELAGPLSSLCFDSVVYEVFAALNSVFFLTLLSQCIDVIVGVICHRVVIV